MNYRYTIKVYNDPKFYENAVVFATKPEAEAAGLSKLTVWTQADEYKVEETDDAANYTLENGQIVHLPAEETA